MMCRAVSSAFLSARVTGVASFFSESVMDWDWKRERDMVSYASKTA